MPSRRLPTLHWPVLGPVAVVAAMTLLATMAPVPSLSPVVPKMRLAQATTTAPLSLGTFTFHEGQSEGRCPAGHTCTKFTVSACSNVSKAQDGYLAVAPAVGPARGMVVFFSGGGGTYYWSSGNEPAEALVTELRHAGLAVVQLRWTRSWEAATSGEDAGAAHVACRPATAVDWIHDNLYADLDIPDHGVGQCGFCLTGASGGASQASYPLSHFGLESILDAVVPVSGPTHAAMTKGCLRRPGEEQYWYSGPSTKQIDATFGFLGNEGPCRDHSTDPYWQQRWDEESVDTQGSDYSHPQTRVHFVIGQKDRPMQAHGGDYYHRLVGAGSPDVVFEVVPDMTHSVTQSVEGMEALRAALVGEAPTPTLSIDDVSVSEGDAGTTTATFTVSLSGASEETVGVDYATADGSATVAGGDYVAATGSLSFAPGQTTKTVAVVVNGDAVDEDDETFSVNMGNATNASIGKAQGLGTILDDDAAAAPPTSVVVNGGFEDGFTGWTSRSATVVSAPVHTGSRAARLGGSDNADGGLVQAVTVPASGRLELWVRVEGAETSGADSLLVQVGSGRSYQTLSTVTSAATHDAWTLVTAGLSAYAGQTTNLRFLFFNDAASPTSFFVDDVRVTG